MKGAIDERGQPRAQLMAAPVTATPTVTIGAATVVFEPTDPAGPRPDGYEVSMDGRRSLMSRPVPTALGEGPRLVLVQNWRAALKPQR